MPFVREFATQAHKKLAMENVWEIEAILCLSTSANAQALNELRTRVDKRLVDAKRRRLLHVRHYLTCSCLDAPHESAWATLYAEGDDLNFINVTSLTRYVRTCTCIIILIQYSFI